MIELFIKGVTESLTLLVKLSLLVFSFFLIVTILTFAIEKSIILTIVIAVFIFLLSCGLANVFMNKDGR